MSDEIKSIMDLNPKKIPEVEETVENTVEENVNEETVEEIETVSEEVEEERKYEYVDPKEDTKFGTGVFDFGSSINRRRELVTSKITNKKNEMSEEDIENELEELSDDTIDTADFSFEDDNNIEEVDVAITRPVSLNNTKSKPVVGKKKEEETVREDLVKKQQVKAQQIPEQSSLFIDEDDLDDLSDMVDDTDDDSRLDNLKSSISKKLQSVEDNLDISGFTVTNEAISVNAILEDNDLDTSDWVLLSAGKSIAVKSFSGLEIESLAGGNSRNRFNNLRGIYKTLYDHIVEPDKPGFEAWLKVTSFMDIPHIYMGAYKASFNNANYIPYTCTNEKCNNVFLSEDIDIMDMVKFKDDASKKKFNTILNNGSIPESKVYETRIIPISNKIAIGFREPSIYNTIFENAILDQKFIDKYQELLSIMIYIDNIYLIKDKKLTPVALKVDTNNLAKTIKYRISVYAKIISSLASDNYSKISKIIAGINEYGDEITYQLPEVTCPECSHTIQAEESDVVQMLFNRHQLALIANS